MRRFVVILGALVVLVATAVATLPQWLGAAAALVGPRFGFTFREYEPLGYTRFALHDVLIQRPNVIITISRAETDTPLVWLWRRMFGPPPVTLAETWKAEVRTQTAVASTTPRGWRPVRVKILRAGDILERWLPEAKVGGGVVTWKNGELRIDSAIWSGRVLRSPGIAYRSFSAEVEVRLPGSGEIFAAARNAEEQASLVLTSGGADVRGTVVWWGESAELSAIFAETGWRPTEAELRADDWEIPAGRARMGEQYAWLRGHGRVDWRDEKLTADISAEGIPREDANVPPLFVRVRGEAQRDGFVAEQLEVNIPGVTAMLTEPVIVDREGRVRSAPARFTLQADMSELPWIKARGRIEGDGQIEGGADANVLAGFRLRGSGLEMIGVALRDFDVAGRVEWPTLTVSSGRLGAADGSDVRWSGEWDFRERTLLAASARGRVGRALVAPWVGNEVEFARIDFLVNASGPMGAVVHEGEIDVAGFRMAPLKAVQLHGRWRGRSAEVERFTLNAEAGAGRIRAEGSAGATQLQLSTWEIWRGDERPFLRLAQAAQIRWSPERQIGPLILEGPDASVRGAATLGERNRIEVVARGVRSQWWREWIEFPSTEWTIANLSAHGEWADGPAEYAVDTRVSVTIGEGGAAQIDAQFQGSADGLEVTGLRVSEGEGAIARASGHLPIQVWPGGKPRVRFDESDAFSLDAATSSNPEFWREVTRLTGLELVEPRVTMNLSGTWQRPRGEALVSARSMAAIKGPLSGKLPRIENLDARLLGLNDGVRLDRFSVQVNGQAVQAEGWLPLSTKRWREIRQNPRSLAESGDLRLRVPDADLAALAQHFPALIAPRGRLEADVTLKADQTVTGFLRVRDGTSRPLGPLGVLQEVTADVRFQGRTLELHAVTARMGGQIVTLQGAAELPTGGWPRMNFALRGENLPFVRRAGLLVRGDLDLTLKTDAENRTEIGGDVKLRDSLFLADVRSLIPSGAKGPAARAPYFAVEAKPLDGWRLNVNVVGEEFMKLRTPVFNGTASARFRLSGTLGEPRAEGEAVINQGNVRLPFATFEVRQGYVRVTPQRPEPQLFVTGQSRRFGYDVRMELTGPVSAPNLTFSSSPPLEAEQVLLMVMAGQPPTNEITTTDRQRMARFGAFFGQSLLGTLGGDASGADRLTITSGENISAQGRETYSIEYRLSDRWALTGEYDEFDDYYGGLKWRIYTKGGERDAKD